MSTNPESYQLRPDEEHPENHARRQRPVRERVLPFLGNVLRGGPRPPAALRRGLLPSPGFHRSHRRADPPGTGRDPVRAPRWHAGGLYGSQHSYLDGRGLAVCPAVAGLLPPLREGVGAGAMVARLPKPQRRFTTALVG